MVVEQGASNKTPDHVANVGLAANGTAVYVSGHDAEGLGALELWVRSFPGSGVPVRISSNGGRKPMWSRDGRERFFENGRSSWQPA
jgi:hypothetical protein